ncbi:MAG: hypothetical protein JST55_14775 [Bacteroidetes bacterium]|nr:hypothetical protein [Bacteroidota bacterium]
MNRISLVLFAILTSVIFYSCKSDTPVTSGSSGNLTGSWTVDKVQLVSAPSTGTASAIMKAALVPFGEISASTAGYLDFNFGAEAMTVTPTNLSTAPYVIPKFFGNTGYYFNHIYNTTDPKLCKSTDGGVSWTPIILPATLQIFTGASMPSSNIIYLASTTFSPIVNHLYKSTNGGDSWITLSDNVSFQLSSSEPSMDYSLNFINENTGFAYGADNTFNTHMFKTTNGGVNWSVLPAVPSGCMHFLDENTGITISDNGVGQQSYSRTTDGGITWTNIMPAPGNSFIAFHDLFFINANTGWVKVKEAGGKYSIYKTMDAGNTWTKISASGEGTFIFKNENEGYRDFNGMILKTTDGGANWNPYYVPNTGKVNRFQFINNTIAGYFKNGSLFKPAGTDNTKWTAKGKITSSIIKAIVNSPDYDIFAEGAYASDGYNITFYNENYTQGNPSGTGSGTYTFENNAPVINLNLPNNEVWKIIFRQR